MGKENLITVTDTRRKERIQEILAFHGIPYSVRIKQVYPRNLFDNSMMGGAGGNTVKYNYIFYVEKSVAERARELVQAAQG